MSEQMTPDYSAQVRHLYDDILDSFDEELEMEMDDERLQAIARERRNIFAGLLEAVKTHSLGQISHALYDVGGEYRRNM